MSRYGETYPQAIQFWVLGGVSVRVIVGVIVGGHCAHTTPATQNPTPATQNTTPAERAWRYTRGVTCVFLVECTLELDS